MIDNMKSGVNPVERRCYTVDDIMEILGVGRKAVYTLIHSGEFKVVKIPGIGYRIPHEGFDTWLYHK